MSSINGCFDVKYRRYVPGLPGSDTTTAVSLWCYNFISVTCQKLAKQTNILWLAGCDCNHEMIPRCLYFYIHVRISVTLVDIAEVFVYILNSFLCELHSETRCILYIA